MPSSNGRLRASKTKPNYLLSILSVAMVLFMLGLFGLIVLHLNSLADFLKEKVEVIVELRDGSSEEDIAIVKDMVQEEKMVKQQTVRHVGKEEALKIMREDFAGATDIENLGLNPLYDAIIFNVNARHMDSRQLALLSDKLKDNDIVQAVFYEEKLVGSIVSNLRKMAFLALGLSLLFIFIAMALINNTIKLALYSNRFLIKNMELVGASWSFIRRPYIRKGVINGIYSGILATLGLGIILLLVWQQMPGFNIAAEWLTILLLMLSVIGIGALVSWWSTRRNVNRYLKMRLDDLY